MSVTGHRDIKFNHNRTGFTKAYLMKAFLCFPKNHDAAIQIDSMVIFWDSTADREQKKVSVRIYRDMNYTEGKISFEEIKRSFYKKFQSSGKAA